MREPETIQGTTTDKIIGIDGQVIIHHYSDVISQLNISEWINDVPVRLDDIWFSLYTAHSIQGYAYFSFGVWDSFIQAEQNLFWHRIDDTVDNCGVSTLKHIPVNVNFRTGCKFHYGFFADNTVYVGKIMMKITELTENPNEVNVGGQKPCHVLDFLTGGCHGE